ncbi:MAG: fasciclin domain-containing protein, partial [Flavobacteriales bacterium]
MDNSNNKIQIEPLPMPSNYKSSYACPLNILLYHVVGALALSTDLSDGQIITTLQGQDVIVAINMGSVMINNANVTVADIIADNGVVHVIDAVLVPQVEGCTAMEACNYNSAAVIDDGSCALPGSPCDDGNDMTTNDLYAGDCTCAGELMGCTNDMACNYNAAALVDDASCFFSGDSCDDNDATTAGDVYGADCVCAGVVSSGTVVDIIVNSPDHNTLEAAVVAAGLVEVLSGAGPFTVFAPTDAAFAALPAGVLQTLLADPTGALAQVLLYHVVSGEALSSSLTNGQSIPTLQGQNVTVSITGGNVFINDAQVVMADIMADNGVVHVIDAVLTPATSVTEVSLNQAVVYPNPASEEITISMPAMNGSTTYSIYSTTGSLVTTGTLNNSRSTLEIDALTQGMYQLKITNGMECVTRTFMKK